MKYQIIGIILVGFAVLFILDVLIAIIPVGHVMHVRMDLLRRCIIVGPVWIWCKAVRVVMGRDVTLAAWVSVSTS